VSDWPLSNQPNNFGYRPRCSSQVGSYSRAGVEERPSRGKRRSPDHTVGFRITGEVRERAVDLGVAQREDERAGTAGGVAGDRPAARPGQNPEQSVDRQDHVHADVRVGASARPVDALGVAEERAVGVGDDHDGTPAAVYRCVRVEGLDRVPAAHPQVGRAGRAGDQLQRGEVGSRMREPDRRQPHVSATSMELRDDPGDLEWDHGTYCRQERVVACAFEAIRPRKLPGERRADQVTDGRHGAVEGVNPIGSEPGQQ
jgi:hypothetical protein